MRNLVNDFRALRRRRGAFFCEFVDAGGRPRIEPLALFAERSAQRLWVNPADEIQQVVELAEWGSNRLSRS